MEKYRKTASDVGIALLIFVACINAFSFADSFLSLFLSEVMSDEVTFNIVTEIFYGCGYMLSFFIPAWILKSLLRRADPAVYSPMKSSPKLSPWIFPCAAAIISLNLIAANINDGLVSVFNYGVFSEEVLWGEVNTEPYAVMAELFSTAFAPAVCEEFLFRGTIQECFKRYGRGNAIFLSAFLFSMMHENVGQTLYTFVIGVLLGLVYDRTENLWNCSLIHFLNNAVSVLASAWMAKYGETPMGLGGDLLLSLVLFAVGALFTVILLFTRYARPNTVADGFFGKTSLPDLSYAKEKLTKKELLRGMLNPYLIGFYAFCVFNMVTLILMSLGIIRFAGLGL